MLRDLNYYDLVISIFSCLYELEFLSEVYALITFSFVIFPTGYSSCLGHRYDSQAFLFSLVNKPGWAPVKLPQTGQYSSYRYSIYDCSSYGPTFGGGWDIYIANYASSSSSSYANLGWHYSHQAGTTKETPSPRHFWQEELIIILHQTKWKHFTKQPKNCGIVFNFKLNSQLRYYTVLSRGNTFF